MSNIDDDIYVAVKDVYDKVPIYPALPLLLFLFGFLPSLFLEQNLNLRLLQLELSGLPVNMFTAFKTKRADEWHRTNAGSQHEKYDLKY